jgi:dolichyl-phosphate-mannose--protein O-mannosyl transferase
MSSESDSDPGELPAQTDTRRQFTFDIRMVIRGWSKLFPDTPSQPFTLDAIDCILILLLTALGMLTRIFRLEYPPYIVFDEAYFRNFMNWYLSGDYFSDIQPALAKLIMSAVAYCANYKGDINFEQLGDTGRFPHMGYVALRLTPAFFGALCGPLTYFAMRAML